MTVSEALESGRLAAEDVLRAAKEVNPAVCGSVTESIVRGVGYNRLIAKEKIYMCRNSWYKWRRRTIKKLYEEIKDEA